MTRAGATTGEDARGGTARPRFHLAFPVKDIAKTRAFYEGVLGCAVGRTDTRWIDFDFHGHQISAHLVDDGDAATWDATNAVDGDDVPVRHFGLILDFASFDALAERLASSGVSFRIPPRVRFAGTVGEQKTMFVVDPSGNAIEFKAFARETSIFAT